MAILEILFNYPIPIVFLLVVEEGGVDLEAALQHRAVLKGLHRGQVCLVVDVDASHTDYKYK